MSRGLSSEQRRSGGDARVLISPDEFVFARVVLHMNRGARAGSLGLFSEQSPSLCVARFLLFTATLEKCSSVLQPHIGVS